MLRGTWKEKRKSGCHSPRLSKEFSFSGTVTGCSSSGTEGGSTPTRMQQLLHDPLALSRVIRTASLQPTDFAKTFCRIRWRICDCSLSNSMLS